MQSSNVICVQRHNVLTLSVDNITSMSFTTHAHSIYRFTLPHIIRKRNSKYTHMLYGNVIYVEHDTITNVNTRIKLIHSTHCQDWLEHTQYNTSEEWHGSCIPFHWPSLHHQVSDVHTRHKLNIKTLIILIHESLMLSAQVAPHRLIWNRLNVQFAQTL